MQGGMSNHGSNWRGYTVMGERFPNLAETEERQVVQREAASIYYLPQTLQQKKKQLPHTHAYTYSLIYTANL